MNTGTSATRSWISSGSMSKARWAQAWTRSGEKRSGGSGSAQSSSYTSVNAARMPAVSPSSERTIARSYQASSKSSSR